MKKTSKTGQEVANKSGNRQERRCEELSSGYTKKKLRDHKAVRIFFGCSHLADQGAVNRKMSSGCWDHPLRDWMRQDSQDICKGIFFLQRDVMDMQCLVESSKRKMTSQNALLAKGLPQICYHPVCMYFGWLMPLIAFDALKLGKQI